MKDYGVNMSQHQDEGSTLAPERVRKKVSLSFQARYHGACATCFEVIEPGDMIRYNPNDEIVHARHDAPFEKLGPPCKSCFMVHAGECL